MTSRGKYIYEEGSFLLLTVLSATGLSLSFPGAGLKILAWISLAPFLLVLRRQEPSRAAFHSIVFGVIYGMGSFPWVLSVLPTLHSKILVYLSFGIYYLLFGMAYNVVSRSAGGWITFAGPVLWVSIEFLRSNLGFLSLPWNLLPHSQYSWLPVIQIADVTGVYGITFVMALVNQVISEIMEMLVAPITVFGRSHSRRGAGKLYGRVLLAVILTAGLLGYGLYRISQPPSKETLRIAIVQANRLVVPGMSLPDRIGHLADYETLTVEASREKPSLIVWPATALPRSPDVSSRVDFAIKNIATKNHAYLLAGGGGYEKFNPDKKGPMQYANVEFLVSPDGYIADRYNKIRLVPFDEYLPLRGIFPWPSWFTGLTTDFKRGDRYTVFNASGVRFGALICWENMFPGLYSRFVRDGANFMVSATNEGFYGPTSAPYQTLAANIFRAVENRVPVVRTATTGVSAFIDRNGKIQDRIADEEGQDLFVSGYRVRDVHLGHKKTFYTKFGDVFGLTVTAMGVLVTSLSAIVVFRRRGHQ